MTPLALLAGVASPLGSSVEESVINAVQWLRLFVEVVGAVAVGIGVLVAAADFVRRLVLHHGGEFTAIRLTLGRYLTLALEFQLGADILSTAVSPSWDQIGKLGAIAVIRTTLNYFLTKELAEADRASTEERRMDSRRHS